jgi:hypothetical protein
MTYGTGVIQISNFLTAITVGTECSAALTLGKKAVGSQYIGGWVGPRASLTVYLFI